jgi:hypothetical protein
MQPRLTDSPSKLLPSLALFASLAFACGGSEAPQAVATQPQLSAEQPREQPRAPAAPAPPPPQASHAPLREAELVALTEQLAALETRRSASAEPLPELPDRPCAPSFCVRVVDDVADPLRKLASSPLLGDVRLVETLVAAGLPGGQRVARLQLLAPASSTPAALAELARLAAPYLPARRELAWGASVDPDGHPVVASHLLGPAVIDASDVASSERAQLVAGAYTVTVVLHPDGARRFGEVTSTMLHRRLAILSAGRVQTAPVVQSAIPGGRISVSFPTEAEAEAFQRLLPTKR